MPRTLSIFPAIGFAVALATLPACGSGSVEVEDRVVEAACGLCQFEMEGRSDCYWAIRIEGKEFMVRGDVLPTDDEHDAHDDEGMCAVTRNAVVSGTLYESYFLATKFELQPVPEGTTPTPHEHSH